MMNPKFSAPYSTPLKPPHLPHFSLCTAGFRRLGNENLGASIPPMLNQWVAQARDIKQLELQAFIVKLRKSNLHNHALHVSTWISDKLKLDLTLGDIATRIDLISKVHGPEDAHKYFHGIPDPGLQAYSALLRCFAQHKLSDKAETIFQEMKELGFVIGIGSYNTMLGVYFKHGEHGKLDVLPVSDIERMEKILLKMEADPLVTINWRGYVAAAKAFMKAGQLEKAFTMLKRSEQFISNCAREIFYERMLSLYAAIGKKDEVHRIWNLYKNMGKLNNNGYRCMLVSLVKMDDIDSAEKIVEEWQTLKNCVNCETMF
ncbi:hypothetical protein M0R45_009559 [Rubus argutus]|uniref:Pentatricopeptide repeat-containing protein n=1 Tax=Rubus argutus TaxID=59490 RepID=A0AAW1Y4Z6_RUBAR